MRWEVTGMNDREREKLSDADFDVLLESSVSEYPPEDVAADVTPWKKAMNRVLAGMALTAITLNFLSLNYILPAIGTVLLLLGFRALRRKNRWFGICFAVTLVRAAYYFPVLVINTTVCQSAVYASVGNALNAASILLTLIELICLWRGLLSVQKKAGLPPRAGAAAALIGWYVVVALLAYARYSGWIAAVGMLAGYFFILRNLVALSDELDEAGYAVSPVSVRLTDRCVVLAVVLFLLVGSVCGYIFGGRYPMEWTAQETGETEKNAEIKAQLLRLGFPEYVLRDLTAEDIASCDGALLVVADTADRPLNDGRKVTTEYGSGSGRYIEELTVYDVNELRITGIGVQVSAEPERWVIFHHFLWTEAPGFYGTESVRISPVYQDIPDGWASAGEPSGRLLCDKDGAVLAADYHSLGARSFTSDSIIWGSRTSMSIFAEFSLPQNAGNYRGYVTYPVERLQDIRYSISSWMDYTHQRGWLQYPVKTAAEAQMAGDRNTGVFITAQHAFQYFPEDGSGE